MFLILPIPFTTPLLMISRELDCLSWRQKQKKQSQGTILGIVIGLFFGFCFRLQQSSFHRIVSDGVTSRMGVPLLIPSVSLSLDQITLCRAKNFRSSAHPRRVLSYLGRVDLRKHLSYGTSRVCRKKKMFFSTEVRVPKHFGLCKLT